LGKQKPYSTNTKLEEVIKALPEGLILRTMMNNSSDTIYFKDVNSKFIFNSLAHAIQQGEKQAHDMFGKSDFDYFPEEFARQAYEDEQRIMKTGKPMIGHVEKWDRDDGSVVWLMASKYPLYDEHGTIVGTWGTSSDVTQLKEAEKALASVNQELKEANNRLEILSTRDALSGLYNHRHFYDSITLALANETNNTHTEMISGNGKLISGFSILLLDIDHFKGINDTYGHLVGDLVIKAIGELLIKSTRMTDTCYRYGGDEFALVFMGMELDDALVMAEKIRKAVEDMTVECDDVTLKITVSIGAVTSSEADTVNKLIGLADKRLYLSKELGRNKVT